MARLIPVQCPHCGGKLTIDPAVEWARCNYCKGTSFVETPARRADRSTTQSPITIFVHAPPPENLSPKEQRVVLSVCGLVAMVLWVYLLVQYGGDMFGATDRVLEGERLVIGDGAARPHPDPRHHLATST